MATTLDVVNDCLASLGEAPINSLSEPHEFKAAAQRLLNKVNKEVQSSGWWFNTESLNLTPATSTGYVQLPGDCLKWQSGVRAPDTLQFTNHSPWLVQRGSRLYDTRTRSYTITEEAQGEIVRLVPFEDLPPVVNAFVSASVVLRFQSSFDGDTQRRKELTEQWTLCRAEARAEQIRQARVNLLNINPRLARIKSVVRRLR